VTSEPGSKASSTNRNTRSIKTARYVANWQDERNSAALYRAIAEVERNPQLKSLYQRLGEAEERHSSFWEAKLRAAGQLLPPFRLNCRTRTLIFLVWRLLVFKPRADSHIK
jgi:hypothetical protein